MLVSAWQMQKKSLSRRAEITCFSQDSYYKKKKEKKRNEKKRNSVEPEITAQN